MRRINELIQKQHGKTVPRLRFHGGSSFSFVQARENMQKMHECGAEGQKQ